jgi:hypothetical protein
LVVSNIYYLCGWRKVSFHLLSNAGGLMLLGDMMSVKQKQDLKEIGFDGLLHVN